LKDKLKGGPAGLKRRKGTIWAYH